MPRLRDGDPRFPPRVALHVFLPALPALTMLTRSFDDGLESLREWREQAIRLLADIRRWATVNHLTDDIVAARVAYLERRLAVEKLTIAFVAEYSRGKSELINALFFGDQGLRLLPSGAGRTTMCPTEILYDRSRPPAIRLLPIETRASPMALREHLAVLDTWREIALDPGNADQLHDAFAMLADTIDMTVQEAATLGLGPDLPVDARGLVAVPRWRYAVANFPHPLLERGLVILDTPGLNALGTEPELTMNRIPDADAIVFMLGVDTGVTATDLAIWTEHIAPIDSQRHSRFVVLNKIDGLRDDLKSENDVLNELDKQVRSTAEVLGIEPIQVFPLSARQALVSRIKNDRDALVRSRLYRLEQSLAQGLFHFRKLDHANAVRAETRALLKEARTLLDSRRSFLEGQIDDLAQLKGKNQRLVESIARKAGGDRGKIDKARQSLMGVRAVHNRQAEQIEERLDPAHARALGVLARGAIFESGYAGGIGETIDNYFREARARIVQAIESISEAKRMIAVVNTKFQAEFGIAPVEVGEFTTDRFLSELDRLEALCNQDFKGATGMLLRRKKTVGALFFDSIALKVIHIFEIADREVRAWMNSFLKPLELRVAEFQEQSASRAESMAKIRDAEGDLEERLKELGEFRNATCTQQEQWTQFSLRLDLLLEIEGARPLDTRP
jgi:GTPase SAR1 family protein